MTIQIREHPDGCVLSVRAQPNAKRDAIVGEHVGMLKVAVSAPPDKGRANEAIIEVLGAHGGGWMDRDEIAAEIARRNLYRRPAIRVSLLRQHTASRASWRSEYSSNGRVFCPSSVKTCARSMVMAAPL